MVFTRINYTEKNLVKSEEFPNLFTRNTHNTKKFLAFTWADCLMFGGMCTETITIYI